MTGTRFDDRFDAAIARALTPDWLAHAPADLGDEIRAAVVNTSQRRPWPLRVPVLRWPLPAPALLWLVLLALLTALALAVVLSQVHGPPGIRTYHGGPTRDGLMPGPGPAGRPGQAWVVQRNGAIPFAVMPTVVEGRVFVADDSGGLIALEEATGNVLWEYQFDDPLLSSPVVVADLLIAASRSGEIECLDISDGGSRWPSPVLLPGPISGSLAELDGIVYVGTEAGTLYALRATDGSELWRTELGASSSRGAAIADGVLFVPAAGRMIAVATRDGSIVWDQPLGDGNVGTPAIANGTVFAGRGLLAASGLHDIVALSADHGNELWTFAAASAAQQHVAAVAGGTLYANGEDGVVHALDWSNGAPRWASDTGARISTLAALVGQTLYVTNEAGSIYAIDISNGDIKWSVEVDGRPTMPAVIDGRIFVGTSLGQVIALADPR